MTISRDTFNERKEEIELYFAFLVDVIDHRADLIFPLPRGADPATARQVKPIPKDLSHTFKANAFLLLYNLVEATVFNAIEEIHDQIEGEAELCADKLAEPLTELAMKSFRSGTNKLSELCRHPMSRVILRHWLEDHKKSVADNHHPLFAGNLDAQKIRTVAGIYGFSIHTDKDKTRNGGNLVKIKKSRNELAHGHVGFRECGQGIPLSTLVEIKDEVIHYLDQILRNIESYLAERGYLRAPIEQQAPLEEAPVSLPTIVEQSMEPETAET